MTTNLSGPSPIGSKPFIGLTAPSSTNLLSRLKNERENKQNKEIVSIFADLESDDEICRGHVKEALEFLFANGYDMHGLVLASLPTNPVKSSAIQEIILANSGSNNPIIRERAYISCSYLVTLGFKEGLTLASSLASKKLHSLDKQVQREGFKYFSLLLERYKPDLPTEDLALAINLAAEMFASDEEELWIPANAFFKKLISYGKEEDIFKIKDVILNACSSKHSCLAFLLCDSIVVKHANNKDLISIPLQAAVTACQSEDINFRNEAFSLFWRLLSWAPEESIDALIQGILIESKRANPSGEILGRLRELAGHDFSNLNRSIKLGEILNQKDPASLLEALNNLCKCKFAYFRDEAAKLKEKLESRLRNI